MDIKVFIIPLLSAFICAFSVFLNKAAMQRGAGLFLLNALNAFFTCLFFLPIMLSSKNSINWEHLYGLIFTAVLAFCGLFLRLMALKTGFVSVQTPLSGLKVLFVAFITTVSGLTAFSWNLWLGAILSVISFFVLGISSFQKLNFKNRDLWLSLIFTLLSCAFLSGSDSGLKKWAQEFSPEHFVFFIHLTVFFLSLVFLPFNLKKRPRFTAKTWLIIFFGGVLMGLQATGFTWIMAASGEVTAANIFYSSRGIWAVLIVWVLSLLGSNKEGDFKTMVVRLIASVCLLAAIIIVLLR